MQNAGDATTDPVVLVCGMTVARGLLWLSRSQQSRGQVTRVYDDILNALILMLALSVLVQPAWGEVFQYRGQRRWQGLWWNPNHFGLLMATGVVLTIGQGWQKWQSRPSTARDGFPVILYGSLIFYAVSCSLLGIGLMKSYSRGAWLGTALGLLYLIRHAFKARRAAAGRESFQWRRWVLRNRAALAVSLACMLVLAFWNLRRTEFPVWRRAFSAWNVNDLSWRNRLVAYEGALQMMAARPWLGLGWGRPTDVFDQFFKPSGLVQPLAIQLNDYFVVGMTLGLPALSCLAGYLFLSAIPCQRREDEISSVSSDRVQPLGGRERPLQALCRSGFIVLLIGFWLDRGLFYLALTTPFWVLLELGSAGSDYR
jgi:O-antigen ligase